MPPTDVSPLDDVPDKVIIQARAAAFTGALLLAPSDFGVSLFATTANVAAAAKLWSPRETLIISGGALLAFVCAPFFAFLLSKIGMIRTTICAALFMITSYTILALSLLSHAPAWCSHPAAALIFNFLGVAGSSGIGVTSKKVVADTVSSSKGNRSLAMSLLHAMTLTGPKAVIFLLSSYATTTEHASVYLFGSLILVAILVSVGLSRIYPYYKMLEHQKVPNTNLEQQIVAEAAAGYGTATAAAVSAAASTIAAGKSNKPVSFMQVNIVMPEPFSATQPERDLFKVYWVVFFIMSVAGPASMAWLQFTPLEGRTVATIIAAIVAGIQVLIAIFIPYFAKWYVAVDFPSERDISSGKGDDGEEDDKADPKKQQDFSKAEQDHVEMKPVAIISATVGAAAAVATTAAATAMSEPAGHHHAHAHLFDDRRPGDIYADGLAPKYGWVWWAVVFILGGSLAVGQAVVMTLPFIPFSLQPVEQLPTNRTLTSVPYETVQATAIVASLLQLFAVSSLLAGVVMASASSHGGGVAGLKKATGKKAEALLRQFVSGSSAELTLKLIDVVMKPLYVTLCATIVFTVIVVQLAATLESWRFVSLFLSTTFISLCIGFIAAGSITMGANIFVANIFASTFSTSRFFAGIMATTLLFGVSVPFQEYQMNLLNQKYQIGKQTFCLGSKCFSEALWVYAALHGIVVLAVAAVGVYMYRLRREYRALV